MKNNRIFLFLLIVIVAVGFFLRVYKLSDIPPGFFADEASIGYNAYTILTKGTDEYGVPFPLFFRAFGEYKSPIQIYSTVPFVALFGLSEFSTRLTSVLYGTATIFAVYLLARKLFPKEKRNFFIGIISAAFLAFSPWHIHLSRTALEGQSAFVFFTTLGLYFFLAAQNRRIFLLSIALFVTAVYSYFPARIFVPLFGLGLVFLYLHVFLRNPKHMFLYFVFLCILLIPLFKHSLSQAGTARWQAVSIFSHPPANESVEKHVIDNYVSHFSAYFLFLKGDIDMPGQFVTRHSVRGMGELYLFQLPLVGFGLWYLLQKGERRIMAILLLWLLLYPVGSMFTADTSAQATRSIIGIIPFQIFSAIGFVFILRFILQVKKLMRYILLVCGLLIIIISLLQYKSLYFEKYPLYASDFWGWQYGPREIMKYFLSVRNSYDDLYISGEFNSGEIFIKFYDPQNSCGGKCKLGDFFRQPQIYNLSRRQLFSLSPQYLQSSSFKDKFIVKRTVYYPNGDIAFLLGEVVE